MWTFPRSLKRYTDPCVGINGSFMFCHDRTECNRGGIYIQVRDGLQAKELGTAN
jgi:hypothetical protein